MKKQFKTFITVGYSESGEMFTGPDQYGGIIVSTLPVAVFSPELNEEEIRDRLVTAMISKKDIELFFQNNKLVTVNMEFEEK